MSASPFFTASYVPGGLATARGRMLHFILPDVFFSSRSHHSFCASDIACEGCSQVEAVSTVCAPAGAAAMAATRATPDSSRRFMARLLKRWRPLYAGVVARAVQTYPHRFVMPARECHAADNIGPRAHAARPYNQKSNDRS